MCPSRLAGRFAAIAAAAVTLSGCATMNVSSYVERGVDLGQYRTYDWAPAEQLATGDPRLDNSPFFQEQVQTAVERQLATRGFEKTASPDLLVHYHASVTQEIYISDGERREGYCEDCKPEVYDAGTLLIDLVDARTNRLVWRGSARGSIDGVIDNQARMEQRVAEAVTRILDKLPLPPRL
jgi:hypothetical protein